MERKWWHDKIIYQIYPKSFYDTNGDGIGDVKGITGKLDYLKALGVDIVWLSPIYKSPMADEGYDISDYYAIDPRFGSLGDVEELIAEAKKRGMYILMDLVVNHCSDEHEWFKKACEDPSGKYGNYFYIRNKNADGTPPTNWRSYFGSPAWDELPGNPDKMYLHVFHKKQPDLNWENPEVREDIYKNINWWLEKGLGGFRIDAIVNIKKPEKFVNYTPDRPDGSVSVRRFLDDADGIGEFLSEMREQTFTKYNAFTVGEVCGGKDEELPDYIGENGWFCSMFDFEADVFGKSDKGWYDRTPCLPEDYKRCTFRAQERAAGIGFLSNIIENHDQARGVSRYIPASELSDTSKKALACAYFFLKGLPFIYQGQEIGMENKVFRIREEISDISSVSEYQVARDAGLTDEEALDVISRYSRDNGRTPMQWNDSPNAGFTEGTPWLKANENYAEINVEENLADPDSVWHFYEKMTRLRKDPKYKDTFVYGELVPYMPEEKNLMAYVREGAGAGIVQDASCGNQEDESGLTQDAFRAGNCSAHGAPVTEGRAPSLLVLVNMQTEPRKVRLPKKTGKVLLSNLPEVSIENGCIGLAGWQAVVMEAK